MPTTPSTKRVLLIHWNESEARALIESWALIHARRVPGFVLQWRDVTDKAAWKAVRASPPDVVLIDLSRLPSHGRETALGLRGTKATRHVPIVFVGGEPEKVERTRDAVPDAVFAGWDQIGTALREALEHPPAPRVRPPSAGYSGTPLPRKLGIDARGATLLVHAPPELDALLEPLPAGARIVHDRSRGKPGAGEFRVIVLFTKQRAEMVRRLPDLERRLADPGALWVSWPKKASGVATDLTEDVIRDHALSIGLVDTKVCAVSAVWSGLRLSRRRS